ncbi:hypothetical protein THAOC_24964 [Thalassiosira oceanica]|uniref:FAD-binding domain-containing protein n=1 Tax=Thalassiosira oceanica TaxID=159749 RepID=K0RSJ2_THAOC|nr:hypothetical protein THAOC_24964 [Thalassiosira oceanica]|eukprot:EJK55314.1 hypothetical protein THAOC_24964 [Thalassiosira oceanica]
MKSTTPGSDELPFLSIGDALHALPPWSGMSGNYSLQDANDLATALIEEHQKGDWSSESIAIKFRELEKDFSLRTEDRRKEVAWTTDDKDYMSSTPIKDFAMVGRITNKPWSWKDPLQLLIAGFMRCVTFLNRFDNYGVGVLKDQAQSPDDAGHAAEGKLKLISSNKIKGQLSGAVAFLYLSGSQLSLFQGFPSNIALRSAQLPDFDSPPKRAGSESSAVE